MARNASGTHTLPAGNPVVAGTTVTTTWANDTLSDLSTEVTDSLSRSGKGAMLAPLEAVDGAVAAPGIAFASEPGSGIYRAGAGDVRVAILGADVAAVTASGISVTGDVAASNLDSHARLASDYTNATNGLTNITGLSFSVLANSNYEFEAVLFASSTDGSKGIGFAATGPAAPTALNLTAFIVQQTNQYTVGLAVSSFGSAAWLSTMYPTAHAEKIVGYLRNGANAGTVQLQAQCASAGATITIAAGSWIRWRKV